MIPRNHPPEALLGLAAAQGGVVSRPQLIRLKLPSASERRWRAGWAALGYGLYCLSEPTWTSWCWAGLLRAGHTATIGGVAAAHLHGFHPREPEQITVWHAKSFALQTMTAPSVEVVFRRSARAGEGDPSRTSPLATLFDAASEVDEDEIVSLAARAISQQKLTPTRILEGLEARRATAHSAVLRELCGAAGKGIESILEWRFRKEVVLAHGLPEPRRQLSHVSGTRSDTTWEEFGLVAELDGYLGHEEKFRDMHRDNRLVLRGFTTLRYGWHDVQHRPCESAWQIESALRARGWRGYRQRCRRCRNARMT